MDIDGSEDVDPSWQNRQMKPADGIRLGDAKEGHPNDIERINPTQNQA